LAGRLARLIIILLAIWAASCATPPSFQGEGGILDNPVSVAISGRYGYVTNANFDQSGEGRGFIAVVDLWRALSNRKDCIVNWVFTDPFIADIKISPDGKTAYIANRDRSQIQLMDLHDPVHPKFIDLDPQKPGFQGIRTGIQPVTMTINRAGTRMYVADVGSGDIAMVDLEENYVIRHTHIASGVSEIALDPQEQYCYITNKRMGTISVLDASTNEFVTSFTPSKGKRRSHGDIRGIAFSKDGTVGYAGVRGPDGVLAFDTSKIPVYAEDAPFDWIPTGIAPSGIALSLDGTELWCLNYQGGSIVILDTLINQPKFVIHAGAGPFHIVFFDHLIPEDPDHAFALVTNFLSHNLSLYDVRTKEYIWAIP